MYNLAMKSEPIPYTAKLKTRVRFVVVRGFKNRGIKHKKGSAYVDYYPLSERTQRLIGRGWIEFEGSEQPEPDFYKSPSKPSGVAHLIKFTEGWVDEQPVED